MLQNVLIGGITILIMGLGSFLMMDDYLRACQSVTDKNGIQSDIMMQLCGPLRDIQFGILGIGLIGLGLSVFALFKDNTPEQRKTQI